MVAIEGELMPRHFASAEFLYQRLQVASNKPAYRQHLRDRAGVSGGWAPYEPPRPYRKEYEGTWGEEPVHPNCRSSVDDARVYRSPQGHRFHSSAHEFGSDRVQARPFFKVEETAGTDTRPSHGDVWTFTGWDETVTYAKEFSEAWDELCEYTAAAQRFYDPQPHPKAEPVLHGKAKSQAPRVKQGKGRRRGRWDNG